jgi:hypothetical protein
MNNPVLEFTKTEPVDQPIEAPHREYLKVARDAGLLFTAVAFPFVMTFGALSYAVSVGAAGWIVYTLGVTLMFAMVPVVLVLKASGAARYYLAMLIADWLEWQETNREIARIRASQVSNVSVKGKQNVVNVNSAQVQESIRLVPVRGAGVNRTIDEVLECDLTYFVERAVIVGHTKRVWLGTQLPSGKLIKDFADYDALIQPLVKSGLLVGRKEKSAGQLISTDASEIKRVLGLPSGNQIAPGGASRVKEVN